jgi:hypothetical protein
MSQRVDRNTGSTFFRRLLPPIGLTLGFVVGIPLALVVVFSAYWKIAPAYSADLEIPAIKANLTLSFYHTNDENVDHGRYLTVRTPLGTKTIALNAFDWAHNSRTSIYVTPDRRIAIIEPDDEGVLVASDTLATMSAISWFCLPAKSSAAGLCIGASATARSGPSDDWTYLGAFDFEISPDWRERRLRFVSAAEQAECIPKLGPAIFEWEPRRAARRPHCDHYRGPIGNQPR